MTPNMLVLGRDHLRNHALPQLNSMFGSLEDALLACPRPYAAGTAEALGVPHGLRDTPRPLVMAFAGLPSNYPHGVQSYACAFLRSWNEHSPHSRVVIFTDSPELYAALRTPGTLREEPIVKTRALGALRA
jgi:hypothetical protein